MQIFHPLLALIASSTDSELARQVRYLKEENRILRDRIPGEIHTRPAERARLLKFGKPLGRAIEQLITIVTPSTFRRWVRQQKNGLPKRGKGRPHTPQVLRDLVKKIATETGFGYTRIVGELRRLGIFRVCRQNVARILAEEGLEPSPKRSQHTWDEFVKAHAETLWGCDFFSVRSFSRKGFTQLYLLVFLHVDSWRVIVSPATANPDSAWVTEQTKRFLSQVPRGEQQKLYLVRDRDSKFSREFTETLMQNRVKPIKLPIASPNLNGRVERFGQTLLNECLRKFILFGPRHVDHIVNEYVEYYNEHRAHSAREYRPPACEDSPPDWPDVEPDEIATRKYVGGLITSFERRSA